MTNTPTPTAPDAKRKPADFEALAATHNARADEIAGLIVDEHKMHKKLCDDEGERHQAQIEEFRSQQEAHKLARKALIGEATKYGCTPTHARDLLRKV